MNCRICNGTIKKSFGEQYPICKECYRLGDKDKMTDEIKPIEQDTKKKRLNLGCGNDIIDGWDNYDLYPDDDRVKFIDLNKLPFPLPDDYADEVLLKHVFEHLDVVPVEFFNEINRIIKNGGKLRVVLPVWGNAIKHKKTYYSKEFMEALEKYYFMGGYKFKLLYVKPGKRFNHI